MITFFATSTMLLAHLECLTGHKGSTVMHFFPLPTPWVCSKGIGLVIPWEKTKACIRFMDYQAAKAT